MSISDFIPLIGVEKKLKSMFNYHIEIGGTQKCFIMSGSWKIEIQHCFANNFSLFK